MMMSKAKSASGSSARSPESACDDVEAAVRQLLGDSLAERRLVLDEQQMFWRIRHLGSVNILTASAVLVKPKPPIALAHAAGSTDRLSIHRYP